MVFHMLKGLVGEDVFYASLRGFIRAREFQLATWQDLIGAFEKASGRKLEWFFTQWLELKGTVSFQIKDARIVYFNGVPTVTFTVFQADEPYRFLLPVKVLTDEGAVYSRRSSMKTTISCELLRKKSFLPSYRGSWGMKKGSFRSRRKRKSTRI
jgi:aminopeptidase N